MKLVKLTESYRPQLEEMLECWLKAEDDFSPSVIRRWDYRDFEGYLSHLQVDRDTEDRVENEVFFALDEAQNRFVGAVDIRKHLTAHNRTLGGNIAYGIRPDRRRQGLGYMCEALQAVIPHLHSRYGGHRFEAECAVGNTASERVMQKLGMHYAGTGSVTRKDGSVMETVKYELEI